MLRLISLLLILIPFTILGQVNETPEKSLTEVWVMPLFSTFSGLNSNLEDFRKLAPESEILNSDLSGYQNQDIGTNSNASSGFSVLLGFKLKDKSGKLNDRKIFRVGFSYGNNHSLYHSLTKSDRVRIDTLVSSQTGEEFYIDSVSTQNISMDYSSRTFFLDACIIFKTDAASRWSLYGGVGLSFGLSLNPRTDIYYNTFDLLDSPESDPTGIFDSTFSSEQVKTKTGLGGGIYLPGGVDFRLGNKPFWYRTHLVYELRPSLFVSDIPELETYAQLGFVQSFALRVVW